MLNLRQLKRKKITRFQCTNNCVHKLQQKQIGSYSRFLRGHNSMNCLLLTSTSRRTLEFHLVCFFILYSHSWLFALISNEILQWTWGSCTDCTVFLATTLWQPWISEVRTVVNWESIPLPHVACWNVLLLWHDDFFHSNTGRICIES